MISTLAVELVEIAIIKKEYISLSRAYYKMKKNDRNIKSSRAVYEFGIECVRPYPSESY